LSRRQGRARKLADAGVVLVDADMAGLFEQNGKVSFVVALHEPIADIPAYLQASGIEGITLADIAADRPAPTSGARSAPSPRTPLAGLSGCDHGCSGRRCRRFYEAYFRDHDLDAILFSNHDCRSGL